MYKIEVCNEFAKECMKANQAVDDLGQSDGRYSEEFLKAERHQIHLAIKIINLIGGTKTIGEILKD